MNTAHMESSRRIASVPQYVHSHEQGGVDVGLFFPPDGSRPYRLIVTLLAEAHIESTRWGLFGRDVGATSEWDGRANTEAILRADPDNVIARHILGLEIDGHRDFYWASKRETDQVYREIGPLARQFVSTGLAWTSTQYSANSAWVQVFVIGHTSYWVKDNLAGALAVRRSFLL